MPKETSTCLHASCAAIGARAVLILGNSGAGKSALTLQLMAYGAKLVADDQTIVELRDGWPVARAPERLRGLIEARGIGVLAAEPASPTAVHLAVDMTHIETDRLPADRTTVLLGQRLPLLHKTESPDFPAAILQYLKAGKVDR